MTTEQIAGLDRVVYNGELLAIIIRRDCDLRGIHFLTSSDSVQQLGFIQRNLGDLITPHVHVQLERTVVGTPETLFIRRGKLIMSLYSSAKEFAAQIIIEAGDVVLLAGGGHGFEVIEECEIIEVKQGPYLGDGDKVRF